MSSINNNNDKTQIASLDTKHKTAARKTQLNLLGKTIYISGSYLADGAVESVPFVIETELAWGGFIPLSQPLDSGNNNVTVVVKRSLSTLFDDIDFATMDDAARAKSILRSLIQHTTIDVQTIN